jgi:hypothetical protein
MIKQALKNWRARDAKEKRDVDLPEDAGDVHGDVEASGDDESN